MNRIFKVVWNHTFNSWVVTSELGVAHKKSQNCKKRIITAGILSTALTVGSMVFANDDIVVKEGDTYSIKDKANVKVGNIKVGGFKTEVAPEETDKSTEKLKEIEIPSKFEANNIKEFEAKALSVSNKGKADLINIDKGRLDNISISSEGNVNIRGTERPDKYKEDRISKVSTGDITMTGGAQFTADVYSDITAQKVTLSGENTVLNAGVNSKPDPENPTDPKKNQGIKEHSTRFEATDIVVGGGAQFNVSGSIVDKTKSDKFVRIYADSLTLGPEIVETEINTPGNPEKKQNRADEKPEAPKPVETVLDLTEAVKYADNYKILDMTGIKKIELDGGKIKGIDDGQLRVKDITFRNREGNYLKADVLQVTGKGEFELTLDPVSGKEEKAQDTASNSNQKSSTTPVLELKTLVLMKGAEGILRADTLQLEEGKMPEIIKSTFGDRKERININENASLTLEGSDQFEFNIAKLGEAPEIQLQETALKGEKETASIVTILSDVKNEGKLSGNGFINSTLILSGNSDLYVGNAGTNRAGTGHLAVKDLKIENDYGLANLHFGFSAHQADRLTILNSAHGYGAVYIYPQGEVKELATSEGLLLVDASTVPELNEDKKPANTLDLQLANRVAIGLYEYELVKRENVEGANGAGAQWYLTYDKNKIAPQASAYLANLAISNRMFSLMYQDRQYIEDGEGIWMNIKNSYNKFKGNHTDYIESKINYFVLRIGNDLVDTDDYTAGWLASYGAASGDSKNHYTHRTADSKVHGFSVGGYGTYFFDQDKSTYLDASLQYVRTSNKVEGDDKPTENYKADGFVASLELGTDIEFARDWSFIPSTQVTWSDVKAKKHRAEDGTNYSSNRGNLEWRLGALIKAKESFMDGMITPYVGANYILNSNAPEVKVEYAGMENDVALAGSKSIYQLIMGTDVKFSKDLHLSGELSHTMGQDKYRDTKVKVNMCYIY